MPIFGFTGIKIAPGQGSDQECDTNEHADIRSQCQPAIDLVRIQIAAPICSCERIDECAYDRPFRVVFCRSELYHLNDRFGSKANIVLRQSYAGTWHLEPGALLS